MIRPEAKMQLLRWREVLVGAAAVLVGLWWWVGPRGLLTLPALALLCAGAALIWVGVQRARFRAAGDGPGAVRLDEGQIVYFGPLTGGAVALRELHRLTCDPGQHPAHWCLAQRGQPELLIPVNAEGAEVLFDAFTSLPGLRMDHLLAAQKRGGAHPIVIWQRDPPGSAQRSLH
ncbi:MAG: hypothetical protein AAGI36_04620 [Pseudomonadota bacterium]